MSILLLATSQRVRNSYGIEPTATTPIVATADWFRFWRVDTRKIRRHGTIALFTNLETLYTLVADARKWRNASDLQQHFLDRFGEVFAGHFGYTRDVKDRVLMHRAVDQSAVGVMNTFFHDLEFYEARPLAELERALNATPIVARNLFPKDRLSELLSKAAEPRG